MKEQIRRIKSILSKDEIGALKAVDEILDAGKEITNLIWELIKYFKDILIYKSTNELKIYNEKELEQIKDLAGMVEKEDLLNIIYELSELENELKWSSQKIIIFQTKIIKLCMKKILKPIFYEENGQFTRFERVFVYVRASSRSSLRDISLRFL